ncbi:MAG TPA: hypothetical protein VIY51_07135 [Xanthobacteraceae bacterium]
MPTRSSLASLASFAATVAVGIGFLMVTDDVYAHSGGGGGDKTTKIVTTGKASTPSGGNTQGTPGACKGPNCNVRVPTGGSSHCERYGFRGSHGGGGLGGFCN